MVVMDWIGWDIDRRIVSCYADIINCYETKPSEFPEVISAFKRRKSESSFSHGKKIAG